MRKYRTVKKIQDYFLSRSLFQKFPFLPNQEEGKQTLPPREHFLGSLTLQKIKIMIYSGNSEQETSEQETSELKKRPHSSKVISKVPSTRRQINIFL